MEIDHVLLDKILKGLDLRCIDKIHIEQYVEKIASEILNNSELDELSVYHMLSERMKQEESTVRKKLERTIKNNEEAMKANLKTDRPTPKSFLGWILRKVKK